MIISKTPFRISFFGGGTDFPGWFHENGGAILSTSFDKYNYISCRKLPPFFEHKHRIAYSKIENVKSISEIEHPAIRAVLNEVQIQEGLEIHCDADLPARSGLGSSSSFVVGLLNSLHALKNHKMTHKELALESIRIEQEILRESVGCQDQIAVAYGGLNAIFFDKNGHYEVEPVMTSEIRKKILNSHLMLFFTGFSRFSSEISKVQISNLKKNQEVLKNMQAMVKDGIDVLTNNKKDIRIFGEMLDSTWKHKKQLSDMISNDHIDTKYQEAKNAGALGGKLLGAGGGGFILFFVEPKKQQKVKECLQNFIHVPFQFENNGSQLIYDNSQNI